MKTYWGDREKLDEFKASRANLFAGAQAKLLAHALDPERLKKATTQQAIWSLGVLFDKERLERGQSTANLATITKLIEASQESGDQALRGARITDGDGEKKSN